MKQHYFYSFIIIFCLMFYTPVVAQDTTSSGNKTEIPIDGLSLYPNPVTSGKLYISTTKNLKKEIEVFNVLGKSVYSTSMRGRELDLSSLNSGIYIIKIKEGNSKATKKLVIR